MTEKNNKELPFELVRPYCRVRKELMKVETIIAALPVPKPEQRLLWKHFLEAVAEDIIDKP
jgi:hypothetical protein